MDKKRKSKACKICSLKFVPARPLQQVCSMTCAIKFNSEKEIKKRVKKIKNDLKNRSFYLETLQRIFNTFIRLRDKNEKCISCDNDSNKFDAGHFWAQGNYSFLRFNEDNVHKQCSLPCNKDLHGNQNEYRIRLIKKIGIERVEWLDNNRHKELELTIPEIKTLISEYKCKIKVLQT